MLIAFQHRKTQPRHLRVKSAPCRYLTLVLFLHQRNLYICAVSGLLYRSFRRLGRSEAWVLCATLLLEASSWPGYPCRALLNIAPILNQSRHDWVDVGPICICSSPYTSHLCILEGQVSRLPQHLCLVSEQCCFKTTAPGPAWISQECDSPLSVLDPSTHFPSTFINARVPQVSKSPTPAIAFVRFVYMPGGFILLPALTAFSILPFFL